MPRLGEMAKRIRSKNAGPFWITVDVFCGEAQHFETIRRSLATAQVAKFCQVPEHQVKRFEVETLHVIKFSFPRPIPQGSPHDRDMHGAALAILLAELELSV